MLKKTADLVKRYIPSGPNLRSFLAATSTQSYFLIARMLILFVTFATKVPYLTFCDKMRQFQIKEMDREGGNKEKILIYRE